MASKRKPVSIDTKLQVLDNVDKRVKSKIKIAKEYGYFHQLSLMRQ